MPGRASSAIASAGVESTAKTPETELDNGSEDIGDKERGKVSDDGPNIARGCDRLVRYSSTQRGLYTLLDRRSVFGFVYKSISV